MSGQGDRLLKIAGKINGGAYGKTLSQSFDWIYQVLNEEFAPGEVVATKARSFNYDYRFVAVGGLERRSAAPPFGLSDRTWKRVVADDFLSMTWEELEHVAHVIRDASKPKMDEV